MKVVVYLILSLAFVLRIFWLSDYPSGFTPDEASFGYDAYSILKTGKDQWGRILPLYLESFGDFKAPLYSYLTIPSVAALGLNVFSVRLPNALLGTAAVYITYLLTKQLREKYLKDLKPKTEYLAGFLLAISPWHVMLSRGAFEANLTTFFMPLGVLFFLRGLRKHGFLVASALVFGLNVFSYHSARLATPLLIFILVVFVRRELVKVERKYLVYSTVIFLVFLFLTLYTFSQGGARRAQERIITQGALEAQAEERLSAINSGVNPLVARVFHNKYLVIVERFITNYKQYVGVKFLFKDGPAEATYGMVPGLGVLYWFEAPFLLVFLVSLFKAKWKTVSLLIFCWIVISPIPASLATGVGYSANRVAVMMPAIQIATAMGFVFLLELTKNRFAKGMMNVSLTVFVIVGILGTRSFLAEYRNGYEGLYSKSMLFGNLDAGFWLANYAGDYNQVQVSTALSEPHIYIAFVNKWDPRDYQSWVKKWSIYRVRGHSFLDQLAEYSLGKKYVFKKIDEEDLAKDGKVLLVGRPDEFPEGSKIVKTFYYKDGIPAIFVVSPFGELYAEKVN